MMPYVHFWQYLAEFFLEWEIIETQVTEKKKNILCSVNFFFFENHALCEIMWKSMVEQDRPHMTI
jgi:hypothetical protein